MYVWRVGTPDVLVVPNIKEVLEGHHYSSNEIIYIYIYIYIYTHKHEIDLFLQDRISRFKI